MVVLGRVARAALAVCAVAGFAGCSSDDPGPPDPAGMVDAATVQAALLTPRELGDTWQPPDESPGPDALVAFCGGPPKQVTVPPGADPVASVLRDAGRNGAQTLNQYGLVFTDPGTAAAGLAMLKTVADGCPRSVDVPAQVREGGGGEPAYTERTTVRPFAEGGWNGFLILRSKVYEPKHPGTADTAVAVVGRANLVVVDSYAQYRLKAASTDPSFDRDWKRLVGTLLNRLSAGGASSGPPSAPAAGPGSGAPAVGPVAPSRSAG